MSNADYLDDALIMVMGTLNQITNEKNLSEATKSEIETLILDVYCEMKMERKIVRFLQPRLNDIAHKLDCILRVPPNKK